MALDKPYLDIPGTTIFDADQRLLAEPVLHVADEGRQPRPDCTSSTGVVDRHWRAQAQSSRVLRPALRNID